MYIYNCTLYYLILGASLGIDSFSEKRQWSLHGLKQTSFGSEMLGAAGCIPQQTVDTHT